MLGRTIEVSKSLLLSVTAKINHHLKDATPTELIVLSVGTYVLINKSLQIYDQWDSEQLESDLLDASIQSVTMLPYFGAIVQSEIDKEIFGLLDGIKSDVDKARQTFSPVLKLAKTGMTSVQLLSRFDKLNEQYKHGKNSGAVYALQEDASLMKLLEKVWSDTAFTNPMHSDWALINLMEAEIVSMCHNLFNSPLEKVLKKNKNFTGFPGMLTHGGTTSIIEACKAYVLYARNNGIEKPVILVPETAHVAFDKAAKILNAKLVKIAVNPETGQVCLKDARRLIQMYQRRAAMVAGSAPSFPYGIIDDVPQLAAIAKEYNIPMHVDACLGGFITAFYNDLDNTLPACDFSVPGVMSISVDTHKYGQTPKGSSVVLFHPDCKASTAHVHLNWVGGMYATQGMDGSRSGADIATTWTVLNYHGSNFYTDEAIKIVNLRRQIESDIAKIDGLKIAFADSGKLNVIGIKPEDGIDLLLVEKHFKENGWSIQIMQTKQQAVDGLHFCLTSVHANIHGFTKQFCTQMQAAFNYAKSSPDVEADGNIKIYGKLKKGVPSFIQQRLGEGYVSAKNTIRR